jgi:hypothetical protein
MFPEFEDTLEGLDINFLIKKLSNKYVIFV